MKNSVNRIVGFRQFFDPASTLIDTDVPNRGLVAWGENRRVVPCPIEVMNMLVEEIHSPWILGSLAIFTPSLPMAQKVYDIVVGYTHEESFGTVFFENDEEIDWVDLSFRAVRDGRLR